MEKGKDRLLFVDIAKGICILLVVLGHAISQERALHQYVYSIHIPTFILLSGFFEKKQREYIPYLKKTFSRLYFPYLFFVLFDFLIFMLRYKTSILYFLFHSFLGSAGFECLYNVPTWFLLDLFVVKAAFQLFHRIEKDKFRKFLLIGIIIYGLVFMCFSDYLSDKYNYFNRYWPIYSLIPVLTFYSIGFLVKNTINAISQTFSGNNTKDKIFLTVIMLMCFGVLIPTSQLNGIVSFYGCKFNNPFIFLFNGLVGASGTIIFSCILANSRLGIIKNLNHLGKHSMFIQVTHYYMILDIFYPLLEKIGLFDRFNHYGVELLIFVLSVIMCSILIILKESFLKMLEKKQKLQTQEEVRVC